MNLIVTNEGRHMLTDDAYRERKWGRFPSLRLVLESKPDSSDGIITSIDDTVADRIARLLHIAGSAIRHEAVVRDASRLGGAALRRDLDVLRDELESSAALLVQVARQVEKLL